MAGRSAAGPLGHGADAAATLGDNTADGVGVWGRSAHGIGVYADAANPNAVSFKANGVTQFARSGKLTIAAGHSSVTKTSVRVDPGTLVLATLQQVRAGVYVAAAVPDAAGDSFTITLSKAVSSATTVAWFLVN